MKFLCVLFVNASCLHETSLMNFDITIIMLERLVKNSTIVLEVTVGMLVFLTEVFHQVLFYFQIYLVCALRSYQEKRKIHQKQLDRL